jgi:uncharacterized protein (TIGR00730 family)
VRRVCVFCGSSTGNRPSYTAAAAALGQELVRRGIGLVYGGGNIGLMGVVADTVLADGGEVHGVIPDALMAKELGHGDVTELYVVDTMHERKALMAELSDAFVALPGGYGTLEEFAEVLTWTQLGVHDKPCGLLDVDGFFGDLVALFDRMVADGFVRAENRHLVLEAGDPAELLDRLAAWTPPPIPRWADRSDL